MKAYLFSIGLDSPRVFNANGFTEVACIYIPNRGIFNYSYEADGTVNVCSCFISNRRILKRVQRTLETPRTERGQGDTYQFILSPDEVEVSVSLVDKSIDLAESFKEQQRLHDKEVIPYNLETRKTTRDETRIFSLEDKLEPIEQELQTRKGLFVSKVRELVKVAAQQIPPVGAR